MSINTLVTFQVLELTTDWHVIPTSFQFPCTLARLPCRSCGFSWCGIQKVWKSGTMWLSKSCSRGWMETTVTVRPRNRKEKKLVARTKKTRNVHVRAAMTQRRPSPRAHLMMMSLLRRKPAYMTVVKCKAHHHMHAWCNHDMMYVAVFTSGIICFSCLS